MLTVGKNLKTSCPVYIGAALNAGKIIRESTYIQKAAVIADKRVEELYGEAVRASFAAAGIRTYTYVLEGGEEAKSFDNYIEIMTFLAKNGLNKSDGIIALGGGTVGDTAGFCAATYMRGIRLFMLPTTLLAMVDSAMGGKNALNMPQGKNLIGSFYRPSAVIIDTDFLKSLPGQIYTDAFAEIIKYAVISDADFFNTCTGMQLEALIARCVEIKLSYVERDELDSGIRHCLNFGHTVAHAVEKCSSGSVSHGKAVAIGMAVTSEACERNGLCRAGCAAAVKSKLAQAGLPVTSDFSAAQLMKYIVTDKKIENKTIRLAVITDIGKSEVADIEIDRLEEWLFG